MKRLYEVLFSSSTPLTPEVSGGIRAATTADIAGWRRVVLRRLFFLLALTSLFAALLAGVSLWRSRLHYSQKATLTTQNLALVLAEQVRDAVNSIDLTVMAVCDEVEQELRSGGVSSSELNACITRHHARLPVMDGLRVVNEQGENAYGIGIVPGVKTFVSDRAYFKRLRDDPHAGLVISEPVVGRVSKKWSIILARRVSKSDGSFGGLVYGTITIEQLASIFSAVDVGKYGSVALRSEDLGLIARYPVPGNLDEVIGSRNASEEMKRSVALQPHSASYTTDKAFDHIPRNYSYHKVPDRPLYVVVGLATQDSYAVWRLEALVVVGLVLLYIVLSGLMVRVVYASWRRQLAADLDIVRHEQALHESEERFRALVENSTDWVWETNAEGVYTYSSPKVTDLLGYAPREILGRTRFDLMPPDEVARIAVPYRALMASRNPILKMEYRGRHKDGALVVLETSGIPVIDAAGELAGYRGIDRDVTDRKKAETALQQSRARLAGAMRMARAAHWEYDVVQDKFTFNDQFYRVFHTTVEAVGGYELSSSEYAHRFLYPDDVPLVAREVQLALQTTDPQYTRQLEHRILYADGGVGYMSVQFSIVKDEQGRTIRTIGVNQDITERKRAEEVRAQLAAAVEQLTEMVVVTDAKGSIQYVNPVFSQVTGYTQDEVLGQNPRLLKSGVHDASFYQSLWAVLTSGGAWSGQFVNRRKNGMQYFEEATICPVRNAQGTVVNYVAVKRDITHEQELEVQLRQAQKLESIGTLAGGVAHEINNPLMGIEGYAELIAYKMQQDPEIHGFATSIRHEVKRVSRIVRNLLSFARQEKERYQPALLRDIIDATLSLVSTVMRHDQIKLDLDVPDDLPPLLCSSQQIQQVLMNLLTNARDALNARFPGVNANKSIQLSARLVAGAASRMSGAGPGARGSMIRLTVEDHGCGIAEVNLGRIFDPFFTTKPRDKGTGLGLSISHGIIKEHGGTMTVESKEGEWTRFHVQLPVLEAARPGGMETKPRPEQEGQVPV